MKRILLIITLWGTTCLIAQAQSDSLLVREVPTIQKKIEKQKQEIEELSLKVNSQQKLIDLQRNSTSDLISESKSLHSTIDSLNSLIETNQSNITAIVNDLGTKIQKTSQNTENKILQLGGDVEKNHLYWLIATLATLLFGALIYLFLGKRIKSSQMDVETQIKNTKKSLEEESLKLDNKLIEVLETQLKVQQEEIKAQHSTTSEKASHSLALKVADEIVRMNKNISKMDSTTKGLKSLEKGIERIQANFAANGYEMVNLLHQEYDERINCDVINFKTDESLPKGKRIINAVIKPQVNYNGVLIQRAQVDVSQN